MTKRMVIGILVLLLLIGVIVTDVIASAQPEASKDSVSHVEKSETVVEPSVDQTPVETPQEVPQSVPAEPQPIAQHVPTFEESYAAYDFGLTAPEYFPAIVATLHTDYPAKFEASNIDATFGRLKEIFGGTRPQGYTKILMAMRSNSNSWTKDSSADFEQFVLQFK